MIRRVFLQLRVLFSGDRFWTKVAPVREVLSWFDPSRDIIISGGANGLDSIAYLCARQLGFQTEVYPAKWNQYGKPAGRRRNQQMLDTDPDIVFAFHPDIKESKGTKHMIEISCLKGTPVLLYD